MLLELHVWGSSVTKPSSFDAECLAAITYLQHCLTPSNVPWTLSSSTKASVTPSNQLPALNHDGTWTIGFSAIVQYLSSSCLGSCLDDSLSAIQKADLKAYSAFLASGAQDLLDLYLYASAANWSAYTRPLLSTLLPFPLTWTIPPLMREQATSRVEHLGLAELDRDFDAHGGLHLPSGRDSLPETFKRHIPAMKRPGVKEEMTPEQLVAIRLHGLAEDSLGYLESNMTEESGAIGLLSSKAVTSIDCLVYGYLSVMRYADVPRRFVADYLEDHCPHLCQFEQRMHALTIDLGPLPWTSAQQQTRLDLAKQMGDSVIRHTPTLGNLYIDEMRTRAERGLSGVDARALTFAVSLIATSLVCGYGFFSYKAMQPFGARYQTWTAPRGGSRLANDFGELGSMMGS